MRNSNIGCFGFLLVIVMLALVWQAILYIGIPLAIIGLAAAVLVHKRFAEDETVHGDDMRLLSWVGGTVAVVVGLASVAGNIYTDGGPFSQPDETKTASNSIDLENEMIDACTKAVSSPTNDEYGVGEYINGRYEDASVSKNGDGTNLVKVVRSRENSGRCNSRLVGSCIMKGKDVLSKTDLREDGFFSC